MFHANFVVVYWQVWSNSLHDFTAASWFSISKNILNVSDICIRLHILLLKYLLPEFRIGRGFTQKRSDMHIRELTGYEFLRP